MENLKGTHGTCSEHAEQIIRDGFKPSVSGRGGAGVYFWGYESEEMEFYSEDLARSWWLYQRSCGGYSSVRDDSCKVIFASIVVRNAFLDLEQLSVKEMLIKFANKAYRRIKSNKLHKANVSAIYDLFVGMIENDLGKKIDVIHVRVSPPARDFYKPRLPLELTGYPSCLVVRDVSCISILKVI